jgi:serine/threonine-protein kinase RsbT
LIDGFSLTAGAGCTIIKSKTVKLIHSYDNELVIYHMRVLMAAAGFPASEEYIISAAASELATNILRYAEVGELEISIVTNRHNETGIEIFAADNGPGIRDIDAAMSDITVPRRTASGLDCPA